MPFAPLLNSRIDKVLIRTASDLNQQLFEFVKATGICLVNTLPHGRVWVEASMVEVWFVWWPGALVAVW